MSVTVKVVEPLVAAKVTSPAEVVLRPEGLGYCVIDEGDSVLIDEARVPLIISGKTDASVAQYVI